MDCYKDVEQLADVRVNEDSADGSSLWWKIQSLAENSDSLFIKKLSRNDTSWADDSGKHQAGFYIPRPIREKGFFPPLAATNPEKPHIYSADVQVLWPQTGEVKASSMRHYSNKGPETHFTRLPHSLFEGLTPASLLLSGRLKTPISGAEYWIVVLDSAHDESEILETILDLAVDFHYDVFPATALSSGSTSADGTEELIEELKHALRQGTLAELVAKYSKIPDPMQIAASARNSWLEENDFAEFDPWKIAFPGNAIMTISREIEYRLYRQHEVRRRATELLSILHGESDIPTALVKKYPEIDKVLLSASQQRKTRAGRSFENHISAALKAGRVRFQEQAVTGGRRPDFVFPNAKELGRRERAYSDALVLAAKTTLRERWKQVSSERLNCDVFLATVDDRVAKSTIEELASSNIQLVVPESLKSSKEAFYAGSDNVITFRDFFDYQLKLKRPFLIQELT